MKRHEKELALAPARGGWVHVTDDAGRLVVLVRFGVQPNGRLGVEEAVVKVAGPDPDHIDGATWRAIPIAQATTLANLPEYRSVIVEHLNDPDAEVEVGAGAEDRRPVMAVRRTAHSYRLPQVYGTGRYPDSFYERVAEAYRTAVKTKKPPNQTIAEANDVPTTTVARWVREARTRGILEPSGGKGRKG
jgi:hypothetical protein